MNISPEHAGLIFLKKLTWLGTIRLLSVTVLAAVNCVLPASEPRDRTKLLFGHRRYCWCWQERRPLRLMLEPDLVVLGAGFAESFDGAVRCTDVNLVLRHGLAVALVMFLNELSFKNPTTINV